MQLSTRLEAVLDAVGRCDTLLDVGCDHGLLEAAAVQRGCVKRVIASDVSAASLDKTRRLMQTIGARDRVQCRLGDGFSVLKQGEQVDAAVIAGIGGTVISRILQAAGERAHRITRLILLPSCDAKALRGYLRKNGWRRVEETLVQDAGRVYALMCVRTGEEMAPGGIYDVFGYQPVIHGQACAALLAKKHLHAMNQALRSMENAGAGGERARRVRRAVGQTKLLLQKHFAEEKRCEEKQCE